MAYGIRADFEAVREVAFGGVGAAYAALGTGTDDYIRIVSIINSTDADIYVSTDGTTNHFRIASGTGQIIDLTTNRASKATGLFLERGTIFYQKHAGVAPTSGNLWIQTVFADGGV